MIKSQVLIPLIKNNIIKIKEKEKVFRKRIFMEVA